MQKTKIVRFVEGLILLPVMGSMSLGGVQGLPNLNPSAYPQIVLEEKQNKAAAELQAEIMLARAGAIDAYFKAHGMPLAGLGKKMVQEAEKNDLDWRLLPAIAVRESTGGIHACKKAAHNFFGWGSCKISFESAEKAIEILAINLGGKNPKTEHHYSGKTTIEILRKYNPPSIVPKYAEQVISIMNTISPATLAVKTDTQA
jgi:hypothetical protein